VSRTNITNIYIAAATIAIAAFSTPARAQFYKVDSLERFVQPLLQVQGIPAENMRIDELLKGPRLEGYLLRSASSLSPALPGKGLIRAAIIAPEYFETTNSNIPFSMNDGALWAGRGRSGKTIAGARIEAGPLRIIVAPEWLSMDNNFWLIRDTTRFYYPPIQDSARRQNGLVLPWYAGPYSIDLPLRHGTKPIRTRTWGQSSVSVEKYGAAIGFSAENEWWGPGTRNALVLSNNAAGFPHLTLRTAHPIKTRIGTVNARLISGALTESSTFDTTSTNNHRSISAFAFTISPSFAPKVELGAARSVYATTSRDVPGIIKAAMFDAFKHVGRPDSRPFDDDSLYAGGRDQIMSLFGRWVLPADGFETYAEWARYEFPRSLRDMLVAPNHTQGYTLGLQWARDVDLLRGAVRLNAELTSVEQSPTFRDRPIGSFYTSRRVVQGYTNRGEALAAAIGPGASSQYIAADYLADNWSFGIFAGRIRWNEDIRSTADFPSYLAYCIHDVSLLPGARIRLGNRFGYANVEATYGNRMNAFFQVQSGCIFPNSVRDIRNRTISVTLGTFTSGRPRHKQVKE
jgi:hypothetical protein